jgi:hypothetical protein
VELDLVHRRAVFLKNAAFGDKPVLATNMPCGQVMPRKLRRRREMISYIDVTDNKRVKRLFWVLLILELAAGGWIAGAL